MNTLVGKRFVIPSVVASHFHLREGDVVADLGAGSGFFIPVLANAVRGSGKVYACEIQKPLVEKLGDVARSQGLQNIYPLWCDLEEVNGSKIESGALDAAILVNTLFQLEDKETAAAEIARTLRHGGKLFVIDWTESFKGLGPQPGHVITAAVATELFESHGFVLEREFPSGEHHYGLAFRKI